MIEPLRPSRSLFLAAALAALGLACGGGSHAHSANPRTAKAAEYRIGAEDVVEVVVWKEPGLSTTIPVRPDGRINLPVAGEIQMAGRTANEVEKDIAARLARTLTSPEVAVNVKEINSARVYVVGEVHNPGVYPIRGNLTVLQAIALAGGLTEFADRDDIIVVRRASDGHEQRLGTDYADASIDLAAGDTIVVK